MSELDPGADRHGWETEFAALDDPLRTEPVEALPELLDLVERMLVAAGYDVEPGGELEVPEVQSGLARATELVRLREAGEPVENDDAFQAAGELRELYRGLIDRPEADAGADLRPAE